MPIAPSAQSLPPMRGGLCDDGKGAEFCPMRKQISLLADGTEHTADFYFSIQRPTHPWKPFAKTAMKLFLNTHNHTSAPTTMKTTRTRTSARIFAGSIAALLAVQSAQATLLYWDTNGTTAGSGAATGTWGTDSFWNTDSAGVTNTFTAATTNADNLFIAAGTTGTITLSGGTAIKLGGTTSAGIFVLAGDNAANTISTDITLNSASTALALSNAGTGLLTIGAMTGSAVQTSMLAPAARAALFSQRARAAKWWSAPMVVRTS